MALTLEQLKSAFKSPEKTEGTNLPNNYYPFWDMPVGQQATIRFLPDANTNNPLGFLVEKSMHTLTINGERKSVPCLKMYDQECPICKVSSAYYKAEDKVNGKKYWRKKQYIAQALVIEDPLAPDAQGDTHVGKVRFISIGYQLYKIIKDAFESGDLEEIPYAYKGGTNFIIKKDDQGGHASYILSKFSRRSTDLSAEVLESITLTDLSTLLPKNPGVEKVEEMLEADLTGGTVAASTANVAESDEEESFTPARATPVVAPTKPAASVAKPVAPVQTTTDTDPDAEDVIAKIRARRANQGK